MKNYEINFRKGPATKVSYTVSVNNQQVDTSFSYPFNYAQIVETLSLRRNLCTPNYAISNAFYIVTPNNVCNFGITKYLEIKFYIFIS